MEEMTKGFENVGSINLDEVLSMARKAAEDLNKTEENRLEKFKAIVKGISKKYASKYVDRDDLEQELWIVVLELVQSVGGEENLDNLSSILNLTSNVRVVGNFATQQNRCKIRAIFSSLLTLFLK